MSGDVCTHNVGSYGPKGNHYDGNGADRRSIEVWAGMIENHIIGPFVFAGNMNSDMYCHLIEAQVIPALQALGYRQHRHDNVFPTLWFYQDGAPCHTSCQSRDFLARYFPNKVVSRFNPIQLPSFSPDLTPLDVFLWRYLKAKVYNTNPESLEDLQNRIIRAAQNTLHQMIHSTNGK